MKNLKLLLCLLIFPLLGLSQSAYGLTSFPSSNTYMFYSLGYLPTSLTTVTGGSSSPQTVKVQFLYFSNNSGTTVTIYTYDQSTLCGGSACAVFPAITLAPHTSYVVPLDSVGMVFIGGFAWYATGSSTVFGY